jgi:hypothetical protein
MIIIPFFCTLVVCQSNYCEVMKVAVSFRSSSSALQRQRHRTEAAQRETLERFGREHFGVKELDDWYAVEVS